MALNQAPTPFDNFGAFIDPNRYSLSDEGLQRMTELWRQVAAGFMIVPCKITQASVNVLTFAPLLHREGAAVLGTGMSFYGRAAATTTNSVTAVISTLSAVPIYKSPGLVQAAAGDIVLNGCYLFLYDSTLGGLVVK